MSRNFQEQVNKCNIEIARLKFIIPGLQCTDKLMSDRGMPLLIVGYVDEAWPLFYIDSQVKEPQALLAGRILESHVELVSRLQGNIKALEKFIKERENG